MECLSLTGSRYADLIVECNRIGASLGVRFHVDEDVSISQIAGAVELDRKTYSDEYRFSIAKCKTLLAINPKTYVVACDTLNGNTIGYINLMCVSESCFRSLSNGEFPDSEIDIDDIRPICKDGPNFCYFASIVVSPEYRRRGIAGLMLGLIGGKIEEYFSKNEPLMMVFDDVSEHGVRLSKALGLSEVCTSPHDSKVYVGTFDSKEKIELLVSRLKGRTYGKRHLSV